MNDDDIRMLDALGLELREQERNQILAARAKQSRASKKRETADEKVINGIRCRQPVDRMAAKLLSKASDIYHPPSEPKFAPKPPSPSKPKPTKQRSKPMSSEPHLTNNKGPAINKVKDDHRYTVPTLEAINALPTVKGMQQSTRDKHLMQFIQAFNQIAQDSPADAMGAFREMGEAMAQASDAVGQSRAAFSSELQKLHEVSASVLNEMRSRRYALVTETSKALDAMREIRQFFIGPDYQDEIARLRDFVELCERLQALQQNGFLNTISDTMLKLAVGGE